MKVKAIVSVVVAMLVAMNTAMADQTPLLRIKMIDSVAPGYRYVTLDGYTNLSCDGNRILFRSSDPQYFKEMFAMLLGAFHRGSPVVFFFTVTEGQCIGDRVFVHRE